MSRNACYLLAADAVLMVHVGFVIFVVLGLMLILIGGGLGWSWVRNRRFRLLHLSAIGVVILQSWLGVICPLTVLEMFLRERAGEAGYTGSFIAHWLENLLYFEAPAWVFALVYSLFGLLVAASWFWVRPRSNKP
jgi:hypothetical protein